MKWLIPLTLLAGCSTPFPDPVCSAKADIVADKTRPNPAIIYMSERYEAKEKAYRECVK